MATPKPETFRPTTMGGFLWDAIQKSLPYNFAGYQLAPERYLKPNQRLEPGPNDGWKYQLQPGETYNEQGGVSGPDGQPLEFARRPALTTLLDLFPQTGGGASRDASTLASGIYRADRPVTPSPVRNDPAKMHQLALQAEALQKRGGGGYVLPTEGPYRISDAALDKADSALTKTGSDITRPYYEDVVDRATKLGYDILGVHATTKPPDPSIISQKRGAPWAEITPTKRSMGAFYLGDADVPTGPIRNNAAQLKWDQGPPTLYPFWLKDILGESYLPPALRASLPDQLTGHKAGIADILSGMRSTPGYADNSAAGLEAARRYAEKTGNPFNPDTFAYNNKGAEEELAGILRGLYYRSPDPGGLPSIMRTAQEWRPAGPHNKNLPFYTDLEGGARPSVGDPKHQSGLHSPLQNAMGNIGLSGSRVRDEMTTGDGKSFAVSDPFGIRGINAQFKDPYGNLISGVTPAGWLDQLYRPEQETR